MIYTEAFLSAIKAIWAHKMRSFLTMLGIIIGIFSVTVLISVAQGSTASVTDSIESMGSNLITVNVFDKRIKLDERDIEDVEKLAGVGLVSPYISTRTTVKSSGSSMDGIEIVGAKETYQEIRDYDIEVGRFLTASDDKKRLRVAVIGSEVAIELYGSAFGAVGAQVTIDGNKFDIIGVLQSQGTSMMGNLDEIVVIPFSTAQRFMKITDINNLFISAQSSDTVDIAKSNIDSYLMEMTNGDPTKDEKENGYYIFSQSEVLESLAGVTGTMTAMLGGIAAISLLVGGIGIMNIMLVSVTERTREIGIQKAIGATRKDILTQFLIEAILVSGVGGLMGLALAYLSTGPLSNVMGMDIAIETGIVGIALGFSIAVGVIFGIYPAIRASKLNPIEALRYE
jgi:putative ABC transport system permease protein